MGAYTFPFDAQTPALQGYLSHKKHPPPRTLQKDYTEGPMVVLGGQAISHEQGTPVMFGVSGFALEIRIQCLWREKCFAVIL